MGMSGKQKTCTGPLHVFRPNRTMVQDNDRQRCVNGQFRKGVFNGFRAFRRMHAHMLRIGRHVIQPDNTESFAFHRLILQHPNTCLPQQLFGTVAVHIALMVAGNKEDRSLQLFQRRDSLSVKIIPALEAVTCKENNIVRLYSGIRSLHLYLHSTKF